MSRPIEQRNLLETETIGDIVRGVFVELGHAPARVVAQTILDRDLLPDETRRALLLRGVTDLVRRRIV